MKQLRLLALILLPAMASFAETTIVNTTTAFWGFNSTYNQTIPATTAGNTLIVVVQVSHEVPSIDSVSASGCTFSPVVDYHNGVLYGIRKADNIPAGVASVSVTLNMQNGSTITVLEVSGLASGVADDTKTAGFTGLSYSFPTIAATGPGLVLAAWGSSNCNTADGSMAWSDSFTKLFFTAAYCNSYFAAGAAYRIVSAAGNYTTTYGTWNWSDGAGGVMAAFKAVAGAPALTPGRRITLME